MKTILITGCSSGFGKEIAKYFLERDWKVVATMRTPRADILPVSENLQILPLDVTDAESIRKAVEAAGEIDALVNNAGIGLFSAIESTSLENIREIFETNTIGTIAMIQAVLPQFRTRKTGAIVNITSSVTYKPLPLLSIYRASKAAINAFTESLAVELEPLNVRVRAVLPGRAPETSFAENAQSRMLAIPEAYSEMAKVFMEMLESDGPVTYSSDVSEAVWKAINDPSTPVKIPAGADAVEWSKSS
jgi:NAD(P)-dependent dehydrogenase (short-subunit alcohol dehydrogenase family)